MNLSLSLWILPFRNLIIFTFEYLLFVKDSFGQKVQESSKKYKELVEITKNRKRDFEKIRYLNPVKFGVSDRNDLCSKQLVGRIIAE